MQRVRVRVTGIVQGVGYRYATARTAQHHGVTGWVRNRYDGSVEAELEGTDDAVAAVVAWMRHGPGGARVDGVETEPVAPTGDTGFTQEPTG